MARRVKQVISPRKCNECGTEYQPKISRSKFCSSTCRAHKHKRIVRNGGDFPDKVRRTCEFCGVTMKAGDVTKRFCRDHCRAKFLYHKRNSNSPATYTTATVLRKFVKWGDEMMEKMPAKLLSFAEAIDKAQSLMREEQEMIANAYWTGRFNKKKEPQYIDGNDYYERNYKK